MYFEATFARAYINGSMAAIGLAPPTYSPSRQPGWVAGSVGYHSDDGNVYSSSSSGVSHGPAWREGDTVGCGVVLATRHLFFTAKGVLLPPRGAPLAAPPTATHAALGLDEATLTVNFGAAPFVFPLAAFAAHAAGVAPPPLPPAAGGWGPGELGVGGAEVAAAAEAMARALCALHARHRGYARSTALLGATPDPTCHVAAALAAGDVAAARGAAEGVEGRGAGGVRAVVAAEACVAAAAAGDAEAALQAAMEAAEQHPASPAAKAYASLVAGLLPYPSVADSPLAHLATPAARLAAARCCAAASRVGVPPLACGDGVAPSPLACALGALAFWPAGRPRVSRGE